MEFAGALTLILLRFVGEVWAGETLAGALSAGTLVGGITGNRADGLVMYLWDRLRQDNSPLTEQLNRAVWLSYKQALMAIASGRRAELIGPNPKVYRGNLDLSNYSEASREAIRWYEQHLEQLKTDIANIQNKKYPLPELRLKDINGLKAAAESGAVLNETTTQLVTIATTGAPSCYGPAIEAMLAEQVNNYFAQQLSERAALWTFVEMSFLQGLYQNDQAILATLGPTALTVQEISEKLDILLQQQQSTIAPVPVQVIAIPDDQPNPFWHRSGRIEDPVLFFGRERELNEVFSVLNSGSSVALIGEREVGKSSLLKAIERKAETELNADREPLYIDLHDVTDEEDFYYALCDSMGFETCKGFRFKQLVKRQRVLLLLDEIEKMTWDGFTSQVRSQLRGLAEGPDAPFKLVVTASKPLDRLFSDSGGKGTMVSPLAGICLETIVKPWNEYEVKSFIKAQLTSTDVIFTATEIEQVIRDTKGSPKQLMIECYAVFERYRR